MTFLKELGPLALGSRLRCLTERLTQDVSHIYRALDIDFEPRWFSIFYLLSQKAPLGVVDIARILNVSHPAVNQLAGEMIDHGLVQAMKDKNDKRKRLLTLTEKGQALLPASREIWDGIYRAVQEAMDESDSKLLADIERLESALDRQPIHQRFLTHFRKENPVAEDVEILPYDPAYQADFKRINMEWIAKYFTIEPEDERILDDPEAVIVEPGGQILFARCCQSGEILGTCALIRQTDGSFELAKMGVSEAARGKRIGKRLLQASIDLARKQEAPYLSLETNSTLTAAVNLYQKLGFVLHTEESPHPSPFSRTDMRMRLAL